MNNRNRQIVKITVFITSVFVIFLSISYAFLTSILTGERSVVINTGILDLILEEEKELVLENAYPMYDEVGMIQEESYNFRIVNNTDNNTNYKLMLNKISTSDELSRGIVKYYLTKDGVGKVKLLSELDEDNILDTGTILGNGTINYSLRLWIDSSVEDNNLIDGKSLSYKVTIEVGQTIESSMTDVLVTGSEFRDSIPDSVTKVVFTDEVAPDGVGLTDLSANKDMSIVGWIDSTTYKVSTERDGVYIQGNPDSSRLFLKKNKLTEIDFTYFKTDYVESMGSMFGNCSSLTSLNLSTWNTHNVKDMSLMFASDASVSMNLKSLDLKNFDTSNVEDMTSMFQGCNSLTTLDLSNFDTSKVKSMRMMFGTVGQYKMNLTSLNLSGWDTSSVLDMAGMFQNCIYLIDIDLSNFNTSNVTNTSYMFNNCNSLTQLDLSNWNIDNVTNNSYMFTSCTNLDNLMLPKFKMYNRLMFTSTSSLVEAKEIVLIDKNINSISKVNPWYNFGTTSFKEFDVRDNNSFKTIDGILYTKDGTRLIAIAKGKEFENSIFEIPEGVTFINEYAFSINKNINKVILPNSFEIKYYTKGHGDYDKENLNKGSNLGIGINLYTQVSEYAVKEDNPNYIAVDGCIYSKDGSKLVAIPNSYQGVLNIDESTTTISKGALYSIDGMKEINIPSSVISIDSEFITIVNSASNLVINVDSSNSNYTVSDGKLVVK